MNTELTDDEIDNVLLLGMAPYLTLCGPTEIRRFARAVIEADRAMQDSRHADELAAYELTASNLRAAQGVEIEDMKLNLERTHYFYGTRSARLFDWAHANLTEELKTQYFNIVANGTIGSHEPPTYAQQFNLMKHRAEAAEALLAAAPCAGCGETCKRAKLCTTCAGEIAAAPQPAAQPEPAPTSVSRSKRAELEADGYVVNGVALMHPETRRRVLLDYCGFVGWFGPIPVDAPEQPAPAWHDAPTCAGLWICDEASDLKYEWRAQRATWPVNSMLLGEGERWYGPIPEDGK